MIKLDNNLVAEYEMFDSDLEILGSAVNELIKEVISWDPEIERTKMLRDVYELLRRVPDLHVAPMYVLAVRKELFELDKNHKSESNNSSDTLTENTLYNMGETELNALLSKASDEQILALLESLGIAVRPNMSRKALMVHAVREIRMTGVFRRIARTNK